MASRRDKTQNAFLLFIQDGDIVYSPNKYRETEGIKVDVTLTFASEYGHTAFQKIYDVDILNESSGASVDTVVMARQVTWIARRLSPLIKGVYSREKSGEIKGLKVTDVKTSA